MATRRKGNPKKPGQKHQNIVAYSPTKWGTNEKLEKIAAAPVGAVCPRCRDKIEWRKKFNKYKPLRVPASCEFCKQKTVRHAYHKACVPCAKDRGVCAMCRERGDVLDLPPTREDELRAEQAREAELKGMRERERRTLLRKKEREEREAQEAGGGSESGDDGDVGDGDSEGEFGREGGAGAGDGAVGGAAAAGCAVARHDLDWEDDMSEEEG